MSDLIEHQVRGMLSSNPTRPLPPENLHTLSTLPIAPLRTVLRDIYVTEPDRYVRRQASNVVCALQHLDAVGFFIDVLDQVDADWRTTCCQMLGDFSDPRAIAKLCQVLVEDPDPSVRYFAIEAITNFGDAAVLPTLVYARDHDTEVDYEGVPIADTAQWAIDRIHRRVAHQ